MPFTRNGSPSTYSHSPRISTRRAPPDSGGGAASAWNPGAARANSTTNRRTRRGITEGSKLVAVEDAHEVHGVQGGIPIAERIKTDEGGPAAQPADAVLSAQGAVIGDEPADLRVEVVVRLRLRGLAGIEAAHVHGPGRHVAADPHEPVHRGPRRREADVVEMVVNLAGLLELVARPIQRELHLLDRRDVHPRLEDVKPRIGGQREQALAVQEGELLPDHGPIIRERPKAGVVHEP